MCVVTFELINFFELLDGIIFMSGVCKHKWYKDRKITIDGKKYQVMRCSKCGLEMYRPAN